MGQKPKSTVIDEKQNVANSLYMYSAFMYL